jgi:hypothetical protein
MRSESIAAYESGGYSPQYLSLSELDHGTLVINEEEDLQRLLFAKMQREARKGMTADEAEFSVEKHSGAKCIYGQTSTALVSFDT